MYVVKRYVMQICRKHEKFVWYHLVLCSASDVCCCKIVLGQFVFACCVEMFILMFMQFVF